METQPINETPKKSQTPLIIAVVAILLCCGCLILAVAGYYSYITIQSTDIQPQPFEQIPDVDQIPSEEFEIPSGDPDIGDAPIGGLGNEILRNDTWQYVAFASIGQGCDQPLADQSEIEVLQEPQNGVWVEKWTVACASGDSYAFEVEYILDDTGATFNIKSLP
jgi:hypothetical protein